MARPRKPDHERRTESMSFAVTDIERAEIENTAALCGLGLSEFFRRRAIGVRLPSASAINRQQSRGHDRAFASRCKPQPNRAPCERRTECARWRAVRPYQPYQYNNGLVA